MLCAPFFLVAGNLTVASESPWTELSGASLSLISVPPAPPCSRDAFARLVDHFVHCSHRSIAVVEDCSAVIAVTVDLPIRCSSGSSIAFNVFGVSSWFFPCCLFKIYRAPVAGIASPSRRVRHGRRQACNSP